MNALEWLTALAASFPKSRPSKDDLLLQASLLSQCARGISADPFTKGALVLAASRFHYWPSVAEAREVLVDWRDTYDQTAARSLPAPAARFLPRPDATDEERQHVRGLVSSLVSDLRARHHGEALGAVSAARARLPDVVMTEAQIIAQIETERAQEARAGQSTAPFDMLIAIHTRNMARHGHR